MAAFKGENPREQFADFSALTPDDTAVVASVPLRCYPCSCSLPLSLRLPLSLPRCFSRTKHSRRAKHENYASYRRVKNIVGALSAQQSQISGSLCLSKRSRILIETRLLHSYDALRFSRTKGSSGEAYR